MRDFLNRYIKVIDWYIIKKYLGTFNSYIEAFDIYRDYVLREYGEYAHFSIKQDVIDRHRRVLEDEIAKQRRVLIRLETSLESLAASTKAGRARAPRRSG